MSEALNTAIPYMFNEQKIHRIMANYMPSNARSGKLLLDWDLPSKATLEIIY